MLNNANQSTLLANMAHVNLNPIQSFASPPSQPPVAPNAQYQPQAMPGQQQLAQPPQSVTPSAQQQLPPPSIPQFNPAIFNPVAAYPPPELAGQLPNPSAGIQQPPNLVYPNLAQLSLNQPIIDPAQIAAQIVNSHSQQLQQQQQQLQQQQQQQAPAPIETTPSLNMASNYFDPSNAAVNQFNPVNLNANIAALSNPLNQPSFASIFSQPAGQQQQQTTTQPFGQSPFQNTAQLQAPLQPMFNPNPTLPSLFPSQQPPQQAHGHSHDHDHDHDHSHSHSHSHGDHGHSH